MNMKKSLNWIGSGLALLGCFFVIYKFYEYGEQINLLSIGGYGWLAISCLIIFYGAAGILLALSWRLLLAHLDVRVSYRFAVHVYGISQLAKYVPGNIFHLAGRQAIGVAEGLPGWPLAKSTVWELISISITAGLFGVLIFPLMMPDFSIFISIAIFAFVITFVIWMAKRFYSDDLSHAIANYVFFLAYSGFMFVAVLALVMPSSSFVPALILPVCGAYVIAWLVGLLTPGAPAGIGIRELITLTMLQQYIGQADLLTAILIGRMVTVGGDFVFYSSAFLFFRKATNVSVKIKSNE